MELNSFQMIICDTARLIRMSRRHTGRCVSQGSWAQRARLALWLRLKLYGQGGVR